MFSKRATLPSGEQPLILIADDQTSTAFMLERVFEYEGYRVHIVFDGISALECVKTLKPNLVLLDINMPGLNGFEVLKQLRQNPETNRIPTILITAITDFSKVIEGINLGADDYLRKPFHPQELLARVQSKLRAAHLENALHRKTEELENLLYVSDQLNQYSETEDLLNFVASLISDLIPNRNIILYQLDPTRMISRVRYYSNLPNITQIDPNTYFEKHKQQDILEWQNMEAILNTPYAHSALLRSGREILGLLIIASDAPYTTDQLQLLKGLSRQIGLAFRKSELYQIEQEYANHLEDLVNIRTSELESTQKLLIRSEKLASIGRIAGEIAHEIKNPLMPIRICLDNTKEDIESGLYEGDMELITNAFHSVERINYIVDNLRAFMGNRQTDNADFKPLDINSVIEQIVTFNRRIMDKIQIQTDLSPLPHIMGNRFQLEQIFQNLTVNARDAMPDGGTLLFKSYIDTQSVVIEVTDTGFGIAPEIIESMFEPFVSTKSEGNGLGLFISYGIVQKHGGDIQVQSAKGKGTTFTIRLPLTQDRITHQ